MALELEKDGYSRNVFQFFNELKLVNVPSVPVFPKLGLFQFSQLASERINHRKQQPAQRVAD
jgi:hypothetical protein